MSNRQQLQLPANCTVSVIFPYATHTLRVENGTITQSPDGHLNGYPAQKVVLNLRRAGGHISWRTE